MNSNILWKQFSDNFFHSFKINFKIFSSSGFYRLEKGNDLLNKKHKNFDGSRDVNFCGVKCCGSSGSGSRELKLTIVDL